MIQKIIITILIVKYQKNNHKNLPQGHFQELIYYH